MKYGQLHVGFWKEDWVLELEPHEKLLYIYLFGNERTSISGIYELAERVIVFETGIDRADVRSGLDKLATLGKVYYEDGVVYIPALRKYYDNGSKFTTQAIDKDFEAVREGYCKNLYRQRNGLRGYTGGIDGVSDESDGVCIGTITLPYITSDYVTEADGSKSEMITAVCNVARGAGVTGRVTLDTADWLIEQGATPARVLAFGEWWKQYGEGRPALKQVTYFWDDFENGRDPFFVKQQGSGKALANGDAWAHVEALVKAGTPPDESDPVYDAVKRVGWGKLRQMTDFDAPKLRKAFEAVMV